MKLFALFFLIKLFSFNVTCQEITCSDSNLTFIYIKNGKSINIDNNYTVILELNDDAKIKLTPECSKIKQKEDLIIDCFHSYITFPRVVYDSSTVLVFSYYDLNVKVNFTIPCQLSYANRGIYINHFSNIRKYKKHATKFDNEKGISRKDFPYVQVYMMTEEFNEFLDTIE